ncbi:TetR/AcrR family transcriptional regulator [Martelella mediterranea]|uniref:TetR family transcriptional regulator n=1 Tax=Martelella mediterranea TaxID=293089 RepID=A0A4R3NUY7_9HYPH|nr:TetR family transcriptional regulator [Martelella mediterranea]TCT41749.1 TetR family transcriptional regulator [Martelella mediterranea]
MRRPRRKAEETREDILNVAERLFRERGFTGVSIADIASELEMSPANIFKHFKNKLALGRATAFRHARNLAARCRDDGVSGPPDERLMAFLSRLSHEHLRDMTENRYLFEMIPLVFEDPRKEGRIYRRLLETHVAKLISEAVEAGTYRSEDPAADAALALDMLGSVLNPKMLSCADLATVPDKTQLMLKIVDGGLKYRVAK